MSTPASVRIPGIDELHHADGETRHCGQDRRNGGPPAAPGGLGMALQPHDGADGNGVGGGADD